MILCLGYELVSTREMVGTEDIAILLVRLDRRAYRLKASVRARRAMAVDPVQKTARTHGCYLAVLRWKEGEACASLRRVEGEIWRDDDHRWAPSDWASVRGWVLLLLAVWAREVQPWKRGVGDLC